MNEEKEIQKQSNETENEKQKELSEQDLKQVSGGASDIFVKFGDIAGESTDTKHKDWVEIAVNPNIKLVP